MSSKARQQKSAKRVISDRELYVLNKFNPTNTQSRRDLLESQSQRINQCRRPCFCIYRGGKEEEFSPMEKMISSFFGKGRKEGRRKAKEEGNIDFVTSACSREGVFHVGVFHLVRRRGGAPL